jgi:Rhodanese-related sulfurtransferase
MLKAKDLYLVNVHVPYSGEIALTDAFIPYDQTARPIAKYPKDKHATIVVYCRSGHMSAIAANELVRVGYTNVLDLEGGMLAWEKAGLPLERR